MATIDKTQSKIDIHSWWTTVNILELKNWVDAQIEKGKTEISCNVDWGYYDDIDAIFLEAT